jgi:hypothetical protein
MTQTHSAVASHGRFEALLAKHYTLEQEIKVLQQCPSSDDILKALKRAKLKVKEEIEGIRRVS